MLHCSLIAEHIFFSGLVTDYRVSNVMANIHLASSWTNKTLNLSRLQ